MINLGTVAPRSLVVDASGCKDFGPARTFSEALLQRPRASLEDQLQHLDVLKPSPTGALPAFVESLERQYATNPPAIYCLALWMAGNDRTDGDIAWIKALYREQSTRRNPRRQAHQFAREYMPLPPCARSRFRLRLLVTRAGQNRRGTRGTPLARPAAPAKQLLALYLGLLLWAASQTNAAVPYLDLRGRRRRPAARGKSYLRGMYKPVEASIVAPAAFPGAVAVRNA
ncbi:MAG: hypothetical protein MUF81_06580 [Verrucomicrobia bacterium]|nr:hypothetical protein [Verrucomicrobiota bacterium]